MSGAGQQLPMILGNLYHSGLNGLRVSASRQLSACHCFWTCLLRTLLGGLLQQFSNGFGFEVQIRSRPEQGSVLGVLQG